MDIVKTLDCTGLVSIIFADLPSLHCLHFIVVELKLWYKLHVATMSEDRRVFSQD